jgi:hypothetical protein
MADNPVTPNQSSTPVESDNQIPYTVNAMGLPAFPTPTGTGPAGLPGHTNTAGGALASAAARGKAATAAQQAKADAQQARDAAAGRGTRPTFTPARKGK